MSKRKYDDHCEIEESKSNVNLQRHDQEQKQSLRQINANENQAENAMALVDEESPLSIFKLNMDCLRKVLNWLLLHDLNSLAKTCTAMQQIVGEYFQRNYPTVWVAYKNGEVYTYTNKHTQLDGVLRFVKKIKIIHEHDNSDVEQLTYFGSKCMESIKEIRFIDVTLTGAKAHLIQSLLGKVEIINLKSCQMDGDFYEDLLQFVPNLKRFHFKLQTDRKFSISNSNWTNRTYSMLEHIEFVQGGRYLKPFLKLNPSVQTLVINAQCFWQNRIWIMKSNVKLNDLYIDVDYGKYNPLPKQFFKKLKTLQTRGFFQRLHLNSSSVQRGLIEEMTSIESLEMLHFRWESSILNSIFFAHAMLIQLDLAPLINLKELGLAQSTQISNENTLSTLTKLERVYFHCATLQEISPFICRLVNLRKVAIEDFNMDGFNDPFFVSTWNKERAKLHGAQKVTIYINEIMYQCYMQICGVTDLDFVELKRIDSVEWNCPFVSMQAFF